MRRTKMWLMWVLAGMCCVVVPSEAAAPAATQAEDVGKKEEEAFKATWGFKLGEPPAEHRAEFLHEMYEFSHAANRGEGAKHVKAALALRPKDPSNIVLEFQLISELINDVDPATGKLRSEDEAGAALEHLLTTYDHATYYRTLPTGESDAAEILVPRAAIWAAEREKDRDKAKKYAAMAVEKLDWTFRKRTAEWLNAPKPVADTSPFGMGRPGQLESRVAAWEKNKAAAEAGKAVGPFEESLSQAAVRKYVGAFAEKAEDREKVLKQLMETYPKSPIQRGAEAELAQLTAAATRAAIQPRPARGPVTRPGSGVPEGLP